MSARASGPSGSDGNCDLQEMVRAIEKARDLALAGDHKFLNYLLEMARIEAASLVEKNDP